jgi:hypothetical protein
MGQTGGGRGTTRVGERWYVKGRSTGEVVRSQATSAAPGDAEGSALNSREPHPISRLSPDDIRSLLSDLADVLTAEGVEAKVTLVGGAALALAHYDRHGTVDVDALIYPAEEVQRAAREVARLRGLRPDWLNNAAQAFLPVADFGEDPVFVDRYGTLIVDVATPRTLLAMKLRASRPAKDKDDIAVLLRACDIHSVEEAGRHLELFYGGEQELSPLGTAIVEEALGSYEIVTVSGGTIALSPVEPRLEPVMCGRWVLREDGACALAPGHLGARCR